MLEFENALTFFLNLPVSGGHCLPALSGKNVRPGGVGGHGQPTPFIVELEHRSQCGPATTGGLPVFSTGMGALDFGGLGGVGRGTFKPHSFGGLRNSVPPFVSRAALCAVRVVDFPIAGRGGAHSPKKGGLI